MQKISALIFCRDGIEKIRELVLDISDVCDQIVLMDSSDRKNFTKLDKMLKSSSFPKGKIDHHRALALGYPDPMRAYGIGKCKHDWILFFPTTDIAGMVVTTIVDKSRGGTG